MSLLGRFGRARERSEARRRALLRGDGVILPCRLRRTTTRGWGPWTPAGLVLGPMPDGEARWRTDDPIAVGYPITRGAIDQAFVEVSDVYLRSIRFQTEAFYGKDGGDIIVVASDRGTVEVALPADLAEAAYERLDELLMARR